MRPRRLRISLFAAGALLLAAGVSGWEETSGPAPASAAGTPPPAAAIPVTAGKAEVKTVPHYVVGIGTVQAYYTVSAKSRVDGQIMQVFYKEGQEVKAGDPLVQIDPRPFQAALEQAEATKQKDEAQLEGAQLDLQRYAALVKPGFQTRQSYEDQKALVGQLQAAVKADQAQIDAAKLNLSYADVRSPITGRTGARLIDPGNYVQATQGTSLVTITQLKPIFVTFTVPQGNLDAIRQHQAEAPLTVLAYAGDGRTLLSKGKLTLINNQIDVATGTIQLKASFDNQDERLWPGEFVTARLIIDENKNAVTVPAQTVMQGPDGYYAYVIKSDGTVERRDIKPGVVQDGLAVIDKGIAAGEEVVVDGQYRLTDGAKVRIASAPPGEDG